MEAERKGKLLQEALSIHTFLTEVCIIGYMSASLCVAVFQFSNVCVCLLRCLSWSCGWRSSGQVWRLWTVGGARRRRRLC